MEKWITANQVMKNWKVAPVTVLEAVKNGLSVYQDSNPEPIKIEHSALETELRRTPPETIKDRWFDVLLFKQSEVDAFNGRGEKIISSYQLAQSDIFKNAVPAIADLAVYCAGQDIKVKRDAKLDFLYKEKYGLTKHLAEAIVAALPADMRRKLGDTDKNIKARKK
jgi:hypothetical protein